MVLVSFAFDGFILIFPLWKMNLSLRVLEWKPNCALNDADLNGICHLHFGSLLHMWQLLAFIDHSPPSISLLNYIVHSTSNYYNVTEFFKPILDHFLLRKWVLFRTSEVKILGTLYICYVDEFFFANSEQRTITACREVV